MQPRTRDDQSNAKRSEAQHAPKRGSEAACPVYVWIHCISLCISPRVVSLFVCSPPWTTTTTMKRSGGSKQTASASKAAERLQQQHSTADASASAFGTYGGFGGYRGAHKIATQTAAAAASSPTSSAEKRSRGEGQGTDGWMFVFVCLFACLFACLLVRDSEFRRVVKPIRRLAGWLAGCLDRHVAVWLRRLCSGGER